jgi:hypothetical protein
LKETEWYIPYTLPLNVTAQRTIYKAVPLQAWGGPEGSRKLRFPDFLTTSQDGGEVVSLTHRPHLSHRKYSRYSFLLETESIPGPWCDQKDYVNETFHDIMWDRTSDFLICSAVPKDDI